MCSLQHKFFQFFADGNRAVILGEEQKEMLNERGDGEAKSIMNVAAEINMRRMLI